MRPSIRPLKRVLFVSQRQAEAMRPPRATALISITDPSRAQASLGGGWQAVLRLTFDDVDPVTFPGRDAHLKEITVEQVVEIANFAAQASFDCKRLVVHCRHGVSRSAAVAKAIASVAGARFPNDYKEYNRFVYLVLQRAIHTSWSKA